METLTCDWCKEPFERRSKFGQVPRYCSEAHRSIAKRQPDFQPRVKTVEHGPLCKYDCGKPRSKPYASCHACRSRMSRNGTTKLRPAWGDIKKMGNRGGEFYGVTLSEWAKDRGYDPASRSYRDRPLDGDE